jgi:hypothetical protein
MKLIVFELNPSVSQLLRPNKNTIVEAIRPHLYKHNSPTGSVFVEIQNEQGEFIAQSNTVSIASIADEPFYHGHIRFDIKAYLKKGMVYRIHIKAADGYAFTEAAYVGVCNAYDLSAYPPEYTPNQGASAPLDIQMWCRNE